MVSSLRVHSQVENRDVEAREEVEDAVCLTCAGRTEQGDDIAARRAIGRRELADELCRLDEAMVAGGNALTWLSVTRDLVTVNRLEFELGGFREEFLKRVNLANAHVGILCGRVVDGSLSHLISFDERQAHPLRDKEPAWVASQLRGSGTRELIHVALRARIELRHDLPIARDRTKRGKSIRDVEVELDDQGPDEGHLEETCSEDVRIDAEVVGAQLEAEGDLHRGATIDHLLGEDPLESLALELHGVWFDVIARELLQSIIECTTVECDSELIEPRLLLDPLAFSTNVREVRRICPGQRHVIVGGCAGRFPTEHLDGREGLSNTLVGIAIRCFELPLLALLGSRLDLWEIVEKTENLRLFHLLLLKPTDSSRPSRALRCPWRVESGIAAECEVALVLFTTRVVRGECTKALGESSQRLGSR